MLFGINLSPGDSWQTPIVLVCIACAATYVARYVWRSWRGTGKPGCGSCGGCGADSQTPTANGFVSLDALKPPQRPKA